MPSAKIARIFSANIACQNLLNKELGISPVLAQILINRGIIDPEEAREFLNVTLDNLHDPYSFPDMEKAVAIIRRAGLNKEKIMIFGDYDVDGITSVVLLKSTLLSMGIDALHYLPHRVKEGYGLSKNILRIAKDKDVKLLITVDCGINSCEQINELKRAGIEVVVTDHHEPGDSELPPAGAIINPKIKGSTYKYRDLAGVGVTYKLCQALTGELLADSLDLVALGTIADVVPLTGENRVITKIGLSKLSDTRKVGLQALIENSGIKNKKLNATSVSFILGPRINASGRMDTGEPALRLLISQEKTEADELAKLLEGFNRKRQQIESKIMDEARCLIDREVNFQEHKVIVVANEGWHHGVLGIVAAKLADRFYRPTIVISKTEGLLCKGSGRSIKNFHLFEALLDSKEFLNTFGGHSHAVGLVIDGKNIEDFKNKINLFAGQKLMAKDLLPSIELDMELKLAELDSELVSCIESLEPFGSGNPEPLFYSRGLRLKGTPQIMGKDTIKFWVSDGKSTFQAIGFGKGSFKDSLRNCASFGLAYTPRIDNWRGDNAVILEIKELFTE